MKKIVTSSEMGRIESLAYKSGASEEEFMEQAGQALALAVQKMVATYHLAPHIAFLCGHGNNGGDGFVAARILKEGGFHVTVFSLCDPRKPLCHKQYEKFVDSDGVVHAICDASAIDFSPYTLVVDALLGTGFKGSVSGVLRAIIVKANESKLPILSIDIPSGVNGTTGEIGGIAIKATETLFLGLPKWGCFSPDAWKHVGKVNVENFGLEDRFIKEADADFLWLEDDVLEQLPKLDRGRHKYQAGYVIGIGGSLSMPGAALMASEAALRAGAGIVRLMHPCGMESLLTAAPYELIREGYDNADTILKAAEKATAAFIGPGMGLDKEEILIHVLSHLKCPVVVDADALNILSRKWVTPTSQAILTPHQGEMKRLLGIKEGISFSEMLKSTKEFSDEKNVTVVLKGSPTFIFHPHSLTYVCGRGDPGMATAGSGDVLTGIIAALLAQKKQPLEAALMGVYLHALAGEHAAQKYTSYSMVATDITASLSDVFKKFIN